MRNSIFNILLIFVFLTTSSLVNAADNLKLTLILDWFVNPNHAPILVAQEQGLFKKYGLEVDIIAPADPADPPKLVALGRADLAIDYQPHFVIEESQGLPIRQTGTLIDHPLNCLVVLAGSPFIKLSDLRHKTIAYSSPQIDLLILSKMLAHDGVSTNEVKPINVHYSLMQALLSRRVDAAIGLMRNVELVELQLRGQPGRAFFPEKYGIPAYSELVFIANKTYKDSRYCGFFSALNEAHRFLRAHPDEAYRLVVKKYPELNTPTNKAIWLRTVGEFADDFTKIDQAQYQKTKAFFLETKQIHD